MSLSACENKGVGGDDFLPLGQLGLCVGGAG